MGAQPRRGVPVTPKPKEAAGEWISSYDFGEHVVSWVPDNIEAEHTVICKLDGEREAHAVKLLLNALGARP